MAAIRLDLFGRFQVALPSAAIIVISSKKGRALLAYLALQGRPQTREKLSGILWSEREQAQAYNSLRHELVELRRALSAVNPPPLVIDGDTVAVAPNAVETDVAEFERRVRDETLEGLRSAGQVYRGEFLDGLVIRDSAFEEWQAQQRERLRTLAIGVFDRLAARSTGASAIAAARQLLALDPLREASYRTLMRVHAEQGETDLALRQYQACRDMLRHELEVDPAAETERLHQNIRAGRVNPLSAGPAVETPPAAAQTRAGPRKSSMAILPFDVVGDDADLKAIAAACSKTSTPAWRVFAWSPSSRAI